MLDSPAAEMAHAPPPSEPRRDLSSPWLAPAVAAALAPAFTVNVKAYDVFWHMATGRWMIEHGRLPTTDPFTYTMEGKPWRLVNGLADLALYGAYKLGAEAGLIGLKIACAWITLTLVGLSLRALAFSRATLVALVAMTALLLHGRYTMERPMILGASLLALCLLATIRSFERKDQAHLVFLVALPLWPLVHGTALLGAAVLGSLLVSGVLARAPKRWLASVAATSAACLALAIALPWWRDLLHVAQDLGGGATATAITAEWESGFAALPKRVGAWIVIAGGLVGGVLNARRDAKLLLLPIVGAAISARFGRNSFEAVILSVPSFAFMLDAAAHRLRARGAALLSTTLAPLSAAFVCAVQIATAPFTTIGRPFGFGLAPGLFPTDTLETLRRLPPARLMNDFPLGGYLIWEGGDDPARRVYIDGRTVALYGEEDVKRLFLPLEASSEALTQAADAWGAAYVLSQNKATSSDLLMTSAEWVPLHLGVGTSLFVRRTRLDALPSSIKPLHLLRWSHDDAWTRAWYSDITKNRGLLREAEAEFIAAARLSPDSPSLDIIAAGAAKSSAAFGERLSAILSEARGGASTPTPAPAPAPLSTPSVNEGAQDHAAPAR